MWIMFGIAVGMVLTVQNCIGPRGGEKNALGYKS